MTLALEGCKAFAADYDPQPFHLDEAAAQQRVRPAGRERLVHGVAVDAPAGGQRRSHPAGGLIGLGGELTWPRPTYPGDTLHVECEVLEVRVSKWKPDRGVVTMRNQTLNQRGEAVQIIVVKMLVPRQPAA